MVEQWLLSILHGLKNRKRCVHWQWGLTAHNTVKLVCVYKEVQVEVQHGVGGVLEFLSVMSDNEASFNNARSVCTCQVCIMEKSCLVILSNTMKLLWYSYSGACLLPSLPFCCVCVCAYYF